MVGEDIYEGGFAPSRRSLPGRSGRRRTAPQLAGTRPVVAPRRPGRSSAVPSCCRAMAARRSWTGAASRVPPPGPGEVRLRHTAIGVNFIDVYCRTGYFRPADARPACRAWRRAGIVVDVGEGVRDLAPGDRVAYAGPPLGAYAEMRTMPAPAAGAAPPELIDDRLAAAVLLKGMTAEFLLHRVARVKEGDVVLVHAAAGGIGQLLCQWARALGATVIGTVGSRDKARVARDAGCEHTIVYARRILSHAVGRSPTGAASMSPSMPSAATPSCNPIEALATNGHLVSFGQASGANRAVDIAGFAAKVGDRLAPELRRISPTRRKRCGRSPTTCSAPSEPACCGPARRRPFRSHGPPMRTGPWKAGAAPVRSSCFRSRARTSAVTSGQSLAPQYGGVGSQRLFWCKHRVLRRLAQEKTTVGERKCPSA